VIRLRTLGGLDLLDSEGRELRALLAQPKRLALLTYLAIAAPRGFHRRDILLALLWPEHDAEHARNSLSQSVHVLRRHLAQNVILSRNGDALGLSWSDVWCDALAFEEALDAERLIDAVELYRGDLLEGFHVANAPEFERWLGNERERLARAYTSALERLATQREAARDFGAAVIWWRRLATRDPYSSRFALGLMRSLASAGDPAAAAQHARVHETLLREELSIAPNSEVTAFARQLASSSGRAALDARRESPIQPAAVDAPALAIPTAAPLSSVPDEEPARAGHSSRGRWGRTRRPIGMAAAALTLVAVAVAIKELRGSSTVAPVPTEPRPATPTRPSDSVSWEAQLKELYSRGRHAELSRSLAGLLTAKEYYRRTIERDSTFALGYAGLAGVHELTAYYDYAPVEAAVDAARLMARRAMALDSTLPETRTALAVSLANDGAFEAAERELKRAIELGPSNAQAHYWYSLLLVALGRGEEALREADRALELDPLGPRAVLGMRRAAEYLITGQYPDMKLPVRERRPIRNLEAGEPWAHARDAVELAQEGRCDAARADIQHATQLVPDNNMRMLSFVGSVDWFCGERARARAVLEEMKQRSDASNHAVAVAVLHAQFGEKDSAFVWLERQRWTLIHSAFVSADRFLRPLRSDPRFPQLLERIGLRPEHARQN
jgi:DNA-binding SARP family transcriptional activator